MASVFKSGCIRGAYPTEWNSETVYRIGRYLPGVLKVDNFVIGRDARRSSDEIFDTLVKGLTESGADVSDIGTVDTPALYFAHMNYDFPSSIMITASHNPAADNGMKIHLEGLMNVTSKNGLKELEKLIANEPFPADKSQKGKCSFLDIRKGYVDFLSHFKEGIKPVKAVIECLNGSGGVFIHDILDNLPGEFIILNDKPDGSFPEIGPNPLYSENTEKLIKTVIEEKADFGMCFDGDADRAIFVDDKGRQITPDLVLGYLARYYFVHFPEKMKNDDAVMYDLRCSSNVKTYVEDVLKGRAVETPGTGHTIMQNTILNDKGLLGAELAGHYYFRDYYGQDSGWATVLMALAVRSNETRAFSEVIDEIEKYSFSGEINFHVEDPSKVMDNLEDKYKAAGGTVVKTEGLKIKFSDWWFMTRVSGTESVLRLVVEAENDEAVSEKVTELKKIIKS